MHHALMGTIQQDEQAARLREARIAGKRYESASSAAEAMGISTPTYQAHENGSRGFKSQAERYADFYRVNLAWLWSGRGPMKRGDFEDPPLDRSNKSLSNKGEPLNDRLQRPLPSEDKIRVLGMAECGVEGWATWNGETVDWVPRPPNLTGAKDAYAVFILGDSMTPRYHPGEIAFIHPGKPPTPGAYVLVQKRPRVEGDTPLAVIKRLVKRSGDRVILEQHNPPKTITLLASDIVSMHRVVGSAEA